MNEGRIEEVASYCETDVLNTYRVWLLYEVFRGTLTVDQLDWSEGKLRDHVMKRPVNHTYLRAALGLD